ncbi:hypothetical protein Bca52824_087105 [Brassica carinata]|uniref:Uncharacterized protein n=1 Tax=Brassica carinata TaxID=52824 RepID=A0A8X7PAP2_BRACI|nr:hypothetical protein Bca52824_087105 [Brassica carinata]
MKTKWRSSTKQTEAKRKTDSENWAVVWTGQMERNKTSLGKDFISIWEIKIEKWDNIVECVFMPRQSAPYASDQGLWAVAGDRMLPIERRNEVTRAQVLTLSPKSGLGSVTWKLDYGGGQV